MEIIIYKNTLLFLILCFVTLIQISVSSIVESNTRYYIPPALMFDMSRYYNGSPTVKCFFIDYSSLRFFDLGELPSSVVNDAETNVSYQFNLCKVDSNNIMSSQITINNSSYRLDNPFNITLTPKLNELSTINLSTVGNDESDGNKTINIIYNCSTHSTDNSTIVNITEENISFILNNKHCISK